MAVPKRARARAPELDQDHPLTRNLMRTQRNGGRSSGKPPGRQPPPEQTGAENFYYLKQINARTPMVVVMSDGEQLHGWIEWYDRSCLKLNRPDAPNLVIQKHWIRYLFKQE